MSGELDLLLWITAFSFLVYYSDGIIRFRFFVHYSDLEHFLFALCWFTLNLGLGSGKFWAFFVYFDFLNSMNSDLVL